VKLTVVFISPCVMEKKRERLLFVRLTTDRTCQGKIETRKKAKTYYWYQIKEKQGNPEEAFDRRRES